LRFTVVLVPDEGWISVSVPAMPGCVSQGRTREEALRNVVEAIRGWLATEAEQGRGPLTETPKMISAGVSEALEIIDEMREAGEAPAEHGYELELATVEIREPAIA
jgi:predicted RNase H-like HicB family nuclease